MFVRVARSAFCCLLVCFGLVVLPPVSPAAADFSSMYARGKLLLQQKRYLDALRSLRQAATQRAAGKRHFGVHFYMAVAHYKMGALAKAMAMVVKARSLAKTKRERASLSQIEQRTRALFGRVRISSQIPADVVGRLMLRLSAVTPFYHADKLRVFRLITKRWATQGQLPNGRIFYLPRGTYRLVLAAPQCRRFRLLLGGKFVRQFEVSNALLSLQVVAQPGCPCPGGTLWSTKASRCIPKGPTRKPIKVGAKTGGVVPKAIKKTGYAGWIILLTGTLVAGGAVAVYFLAIAPRTQPSRVRVRGTLW